ncbi:hypothetical protein K7H21_12335 [Klebsiella sp. CTHL.F3a]|uniref:hypothetical protein n=1 Tax=Klebsiella TaxID=570 RepID=UPI001CA781E7|nr:MULTISPECIES: hypothetical protein [Klebsiella]QZY82343.1 hypothetical protein K7H21_12335 [Klebsiella sp. CTHL.F3a]WND12306.1 hypothetical protein RIV03_11750 [Klebsiella pasteurii]
MSAKARFLKKLQEQHPRSTAFDTKAEADIAAFRQRISLLHESMDEWLAGTEIRTEATATSLIEFLIGGATFSVPGIALHYAQRSIRFTPIFLYGQGVTGCIEVCLTADSKIRPLYRLFMRSGEQDNWTWCPAGTQSGKPARFDEEAFFTMIAPLLPE